MGVSTSRLMDTLWPPVEPCSPGNLDFQTRRTWTWGMGTKMPAVHLIRVMTESIMPTPTIPEARISDEGKGRCRPHIAPGHCCFSPEKHWAQQVPRLHPICCLIRPWGPL